MYEVIEVEKTVSPNFDSVEPNDVPVNDWPVLRCKVAGNEASRDDDEPYALPRVADGSDETVAYPRLASADADER